MNKKPVLVVLAAGMGSRYGGLKQIDPVGNYGEAILDYSVYDAHEAGFETAVIPVSSRVFRTFYAILFWSILMNYDIRHKKHNRMMLILITLLRTP